MVPNRILPLFFLWQLLGSVVNSFGGTTYTAAVLRLPDDFIFFDARHLSQDGRSGGYVRISNFIDPIDVASIWGTDGEHTILPLPTPYLGAYVQNFATDGKVVGSIRYRSEPFPVAVTWDADGGNFRTLPDFGHGGIATAANSSIIVGDTGDPTITAQYWPRLTLWDADGTNPRLVTGIDQSFGTRCYSVNTRGTYVGSSFDANLNIAGIIGRDGTAHHMVYPGFGRILGSKDINEHDIFVGGWLPGLGLHERAFVAEAFGKSIRDLGLLGDFPGTVAGAINDHGAIVGAALDGGTGVRALYWPPGAVEPVDFNTMVDLPAWETLVEAIDINNAGQVLARGYGGYYLFTPVPEPGLLATATFVLAALPRRRVRRERWALFASTGPTPPRRSPLQPSPQ